MRELFLRLLKTRFEGISDNILGRTATKLAKTATTETTEEQAKATVEAMTWQQLLDSYADYRANEASTTAVQNYEQKHGIKDGKPVEKPTPAPTPDDTPAWATALIEQNKQLATRLAKMEGERVTTNRKQQLTSITSKLPESLRKPYERIALEGMSDEEFDTFVGEVTTEVDGIASEVKAQGAVFGRPANFGNQGNEKQLTKEQMDAISHRDGTASTEGQPF